MEEATNNEVNPIRRVHVPQVPKRIPLDLVWNHKSK